MRAGELTGLDADAMVRIGHAHWLRIPIGKLRNDRYVPLHPQPVELLTDRTATNLEHIRAHRRLVARFIRHHLDETGRNGKEPKSSAIDIWERRAWVPLGS